MSAEVCKKCGKLRKVDIIIASDGWHQPPCYNCGDPGYIEPLENSPDADWVETTPIGKDDG